MITADRAVEIRALAARLAENDPSQLKEGDLEIAAQVVSDYVQLLTVGRGTGERDMARELARVIHGW